MSEHIQVGGKVCVDGTKEEGTIVQIDRYGTCLVDLGTGETRTYKHFRLTPICSSEEGTEPKDTIEATLAERGKQYGEFREHAYISQLLKSAMKWHSNEDVAADIPSRWSLLAPDQQEALEMMVHKIARILNGNPDYEDSWRDIAGYATLVSKRLLEEQQRPANPVSELPEEILLESNGYPK